MRIVVILLAATMLGAGLSLNTIHKIVPTFENMPQRMKKMNADSGNATASAFTTIALTGGTSTACLTNVVQAR